MKSNGKRKDFFYSDVDNLYIKENYKKVPVKDIASHLGVSAAALGHKIVKMGLRKPKKRKAIHKAQTPTYTQFIRINITGKDLKECLNIAKKLNELGLDYQV